MTTRTRILTIVLVLGTANACFAGNLLTYDNEGELQGAAFSAVSTKSELVSGTLNYCASEDKAFSARAIAVTSGWTERNGKYLVLAPILRSEMRENAVREGALAEWREFEEKTFPAQQEYARSVYIGLLKIQPMPQRMELCESFAGAIDAGKMDFSADTQLIVYLDRRLSELTKSKSN